MGAEMKHENKWQWMTVNTSICCTAEFENVRVNAFRGR